MFYLGFFRMENGDNSDAGLTESYLAQSYAVMEGINTLESVKDIFSIQLKQK